MAYTLSNQLRDGLSELNLLKYGRATGGSTTTVVDTARPSTEDGQSFVGGTLFILRDTAGAAPEGQFSRITAYANNTFTLADTLTASVALGDRYGVTTNQFNHDELIELANDALRRFEIALVDTSLTSATLQTEYSLPVALKMEDLMRVEYQGRTNNAVDNQWITIHDAEVTFSAPDSVATLRIPQIPANRTIRITYMGLHPALNDYDDAVAEVIHPELAKFSLAERLANRMTEKTKNVADPFTRGFNKASENYERALVMHPIRKPQKRSKLNILGHDTYIWRRF